MQTDPWIRVLRTHSLYMAASEPGEQASLSHRRTCFTLSASCVASVSTSRRSDVSDRACAGGHEQGGASPGVFTLMTT